MTQAGPGQSASQAVVDFVLRTLQVKTNVCTLQNTRAGYTLVQRTLADYNFIFVTRGRPVWVLADQEFDLKPGDLLLVPPGVAHHGFSRTRRVTLGSVHIEATLPGGQDVFELLIPPRVQPVPAGCMLDRYLRGAMAEFDRPDSADALLMLPSWARLITLEVLRHDARAGLLEHRPIDPLVAAVLDDLNQRLAQPMTLGEIAERSGFSPQHLNRVFRRVLGMTPLQYLTRARLERAAALLEDGRLTVSSVAAKAGFTDPYYFSRLFRRHFGRSPAQYRDSLDMAATQDRFKKSIPAFRPSISTPGSAV